MTATELFKKFFVNGTNKLNLGYVESIPEFAKLKTCEQNPKYHMEGNAWEHTKKCVEAAYENFDKVFPDELFVLLERDQYFKWVVLAVLFHDIGKGETTEFFKGAWHSYNHEYVGEKIVRRMLWDAPVPYREMICATTRNHMRVLRLPDSKNCINEVIDLSRTWCMSWRVLWFVEWCDTLGSVPSEPNDKDISRSKMEFIWSLIKTLNCEDQSFGHNTSISYMYDALLSGMKFNWEHLLKKQCVCVLFGLPGAGKNTFIDNFFAGDPTRKERWSVVSRDDIRAELGYCKEGDKVVLSPEKEDEVTKVFNERLVQYVKEGKNVFINNLNLKKKYRDAYKTLLAPLGKNICWEYDYFEAPGIESNIERRPTFPENVLRGMIGTIEWPQPDEYYNLKYHRSDK